MEKLFEKFSIPKLLVISFISVIAVGSFVLALPICSRENVTLLEAFFTATSATCVTGLMTVTAATDYTLLGQIIILIMIQIGGLGLMSFVTFYMDLLSESLDLKQRTFVRDSLNKADSSDVRTYLRKMFLYTLALETVGFILYFPEFYDGSFYSCFKALFLSVSAFCNAGIDIIGSSSLVPYQTNFVVNFTTSFLIVAGGIGYAVWFDLTNQLKLFYKLNYTFKTFVRKLQVHSKLVIMTSLVLILSGGVLIFALEYSNCLSGFSFFEKLEISFFNSISLRTAGFSTVDYSLLKDPTKIVMIPYMIIGASPGGTGGGMKTTTFFLLVFTIYSQLKGSGSMHIFGRRIKKSDFIKATSIFAMYMLCIITAMVLITSFENMDALDLFFEVSSAIGTVGLSTGVTSSLSASSKLLIIALMFIGRLGPITIAMSFNDSSSKDIQIRYPDTNIIVG